MNPKNDGQKVSHHPWPPCERRSVTSVYLSEDDVTLTQCPGNGIRVGFGFLDGRAIQGKRCPRKSRQATKRPSQDW